MLYIKDGRIKFAVYYALVLGALIAVWMGAPGAFMRGGFLGASLLLGFGLGVDVIGATIARFQVLDSWSARCMWAYRTAASHTIMALIGLLMCIMFTSWSPKLAAVIGACGLIAILVILIREGMERRNSHSASVPDEAAEIPVHTSSAIRLSDWTLVLAVSMDATICMPAQSSLITEWSHSQILFAMLLVGVVVGLCAVIGGVVGSVVLRSGNRTALLSRFDQWGFVAQVLVLTFIGWRSVMPLWTDKANEVAAAGICSLLTTALFAYLFTPKKNLARTE